MTDKGNVDEVRNVVFYDADCSLCVHWARRFAAPLEHHGFALVPLQSPAARTALHLAETDLLTEMRVMTKDGLILGGADAVVYLARTIFKPIRIVTGLPGFKPLLRLGYRWVARHRPCTDGSCEKRRRHHGPTSFFEMP